MDWKIKDKHGRVREVDAVGPKNALLAGRLFMSCDFAGLDMTETRANGAKFFFCTFKDTILDGADLRNATMANCDLTRARIRGANCRGARLTGIFADTDLRGTDLRGTAIARRPVWRRPGSLFLGFNLMDERTRLRLPSGSRLIKSSRQIGPIAGAGSRRSVELLQLGDCMLGVLERLPIIGTNATNKVEAYNVLLTALDSVASSIWMPEIEDPETG